MDSEREFREKARAEEEAKVQAVLVKLTPDELAILRGKGLR